MLPRLVIAGVLATSSFALLAGFVFPSTVPGSPHQWSHPPVATSERAGTRSIRAYMEIAEALERSSLDGVAENAMVIANFFGDANHGIAMAAVRLARSEDLETAREHFEELRTLFARSGSRNTDRDIEL